MTDNEIINIGDVCTYSYLDKNKSLSIVEVVKELSDEVVVVKFHQVINDDSGIEVFAYLLDKGKTMNVSKKYLTKIDLINRQKAEIERLKYNLKAVLDERADHSEAIKEFAERLKKESYERIDLTAYVEVSDIDNLVNEMVGE